MSLLVISGILGQFVNTLTAYYKYSLSNRENVLQSIQMQLSKKPKTLSELFALLLKPTSNFEKFKKKMTLIHYVFWKLRTTKDVVR